MWSIISSSVCLQIFVDVVMILCGFLYASIKLCLCLLSQSILNIDYYAVRLVL